MAGQIELIWYEFNDTHIPLLKAMLAELEKTKKATIALEVVRGPENARVLDASKDTFFMPG